MNVTEFACVWLPLVLILMDAGIYWPRKRR